MQAELILFIIIFVYGIVLGSFMNVLIYRIPLKENIATNRSHCMRCGRQIKWYDLIPLASYIILRGKCRYCGEKISFQYPLVEAINGIGYVVIFAVNGFNLLSILFCLMYSVLIVISVIDWRTYEIPYSMLISMGVIGVLRLVVDRANIAEHLIGFFAVSAFLYAVFWISNGKWIGGGDIYLMAAAGLFLGWKNIILALALGCILGSMIHLILMRVCNKGRMLAFGPYLSAGIVISMLYGTQMIEWYLGLFF